MVSEEFTRPPKENLSNDVPEFLPLPQEYSYGEGAGETRKQKRKLTRFAAGVIAAAVAVSMYGKQPSAPIIVPTEPTAVTLPAAEPPTVPTQPPTILTEPTTLQETEPLTTEPAFIPEILSTYENPGNICVITVYSDIYDLETFGNQILFEETFSESEFTELDLPDFPIYEGRSVLGYAIEYSPISADFQSIGYNPGSKSFAVSVGNKLTLDELQLVPVWEEDQIRHVNLHPVWVANEGFTEWEYAPVITLDSGDKVISFPIDLPLVSGGTFYVCAMTPTREGYTFAGWYNEADERVYSIFTEDLFTTVQDGTEDIDWTKPTNITLTAKWVKNP